MTSGFEERPMTTSYQPTESEVALSRRIDEYLREHKLSEVRFAWLCGLSDTHVNRIRGCKLNGPLRASTVEAIESALRFAPRKKASKKRRKKITAPAEVLVESEGSGGVWSRIWKIISKAMGFT